MSIESHTDLEGVTEAGRVTTETLDALARHVRPGATTAELDDVAAAVLARNGARSAPAMVYGFPGTVLISVNDEIVHGIPARGASSRAISSALTSRWKKTATLPTRRAA